MSRLKSTIYARMEEMSFRSAAAVALGPVSYAAFGPEPVPHQATFSP